MAARKACCDGIARCRFFYNLWVYVPWSARLKLNNLASGDLRVEKVAGETEATIVNGSMFLANVSGAVVAHAVNGRIHVDCAAIVPDKPMALSSVNGNIHIALPANCQAQVKLESLTGRIVCDFEIQKLRTGRPPSVNEASPGESPLPGLPGKTTAGTMNGGGPQITVKTVNGSIEKKFPVGTNLEGQLGNGGASVKLHSVNGSIEIKKADGESAK